MNEDIKEILYDIDNQECYYVGINGCLYQDLTKEKLLLIKDYITNLQEGNKKLNNIIEKLEKYLNEELKNYTIEIENKNKGKLGYTLPIKGEIKNILDKLNELKGDNK